MGPPQNDVLPGPKYPTWGCKCGTDGNWASRLKCRGCQQPAPLRIQADAKAAAQQLRSPSQRGPKGAWANGPPGESASIKAPKAELSALRAQVGGGGGGSAQ
eukprot:5693670-Pyramimonas_sp.AAC.1